MQAPAPQKYEVRRTSPPPDLLGLYCLESKC